MKTEIQEKLEQLAFNRTTPFCYGCYVKAPKGVCPHCHSDDLMRHLPIWFADYNNSHPHSGLGMMSPLEYREEIFKNQEVSV